MVDREGARMLAEVYNHMTDEQKINLPLNLCRQHSDFLLKNGYRMVFGRWHLPKYQGPYSR